MEKYKFANCGCEFPIVGHLEDDRPAIIFTPKIDDINMDCSRTWDLISSGNTKGCFQLESQLGQSLARKLKPRNIEHLSALVSIMRPGCVSGNTTVMIRHYNKNNKKTYIRISLRELYLNQDKYKTIISLNEKTGKLQKHNILSVIYQGHKETYKINFRKFNRTKILNNQEGKKDRNYNLECTLDHKILTNKGWKELQDIQPGECIGILKYNGTRQPRKYVTGKSSFREICYRHYEYHCIFCDWKSGSLDVNHLDGNRHTNNNPDNLCFMCPNHHRMYSEDNISKKECIEKKQKYKLIQYSDIEWVEFVSKTYTGITDVYDIIMDDPHHNFIAGNVVVHNCLEAIHDKKSVTMHYIDRKNGLEEVTYFHPALKPALEKTYGEMIYQEQAMQIAKDIAGFSLQQADELRKAIGKKKTDLMAEVKIKFLEGTKKQGVVTDEEAMQIFDWIEKSQRYSFNKSHAVSYAYNSYLSAFTKAHFSRGFFTSYLHYAEEKAKPFVEIHELVQNARLMGIDVTGPDMRFLFKHFKLFNKVIRFGFFDMKGIGESAWKKILSQLAKVEKLLGKNVDQWNWLEFLVHFSQNINSTAISAFINSGAIAYMGISRTHMMYEYNLYDKLTGREKEWIIGYMLVAKNSSLKLEDILSAMTISASGKGGACASEKRKTIIGSLLKTLKNPPYDLTDAPEWMASVEESLLGIPLTCTSLDACDTSAANCTCLQYTQKENPKITIIAAKIDNINEIKIKSGKNKGQKMAFLKISDLTSNMDCVIFSDVWTEAKKIAFIDNNILVHGERSKDGASLVVKRMWQI